MTGRHAAAIGGLAVLMLAAWLLLRTGPDADSTADGLDLGRLVGSDVQYVRIDRPGVDEPIELRASAGGWTVNGYPATDSLVRATLAGLDTLPPGRLIARSAANHGRLRLAADSAVRVRIGPAGQPEVEFLVGEAGSDGRFARLPDDDASYVLPAEVLDPLTRPEDDWRDYTIVQVDTAAVRRIVIRRRGEAATELRRRVTGDAGSDASGWTIDGAPADTAVVRIYLNVLGGLQATGFPADSFVYAADFEDPLATVDLFVDAGAADAGTGVANVPDVSLLFSTGLDHPDVLVRRADYAIVYALDRVRANVLTTSGERFRQR